MGWKQWVWEARLTEKRSFPKKIGLLVIGLWVGVAVGIVVLGVGSIMGRVSFDLDSPLNLEKASLMDTNVPAPDFELLSTDGELISLSGQQGKVVVVNFWATWCGPCVQEIPMFQDYFNQYGSDLVILGINEKESPDVVRAFLKEFNVSYPILFDRSADLAPVYRLMALPVTVFVDRDGILRFHHVGIMSEEQFSNYLKALGAIQ